MKYEVIFAGIGGQGVILAGTLLGEAAVASGLKASQTQAYGVSARGGFTKTDVVMSDNEILYPYALSPDIVVVLAEEALVRYLDIENKNCKVVYDSGLIDASKYKLDSRFVGFPITKTAIEMGSSRSANVLSLGIVASCLKAISTEALFQTLAEAFSPKIRDINAKILQKGIDVGNEIISSR
jgi:2-oxoglutarate ferredoxin oxidoreductase subunit gamma